MSTSVEITSVGTRHKSSAITYIVEQRDDTERHQSISAELVTSSELSDYQRLPVWDRRRYFGSLVRNFFANLLPALYIVLSRIWIAQLDPSLVAVANSYNYVSEIGQAIIQGFPNAGWRLVGDSTRSKQERFGLALTLISVVAAVGALLTVSLISAAPLFAAAFVPEEVRAASYYYIRLGSGSTFCDIVVAVVTVCTRALDEPDIPLAVQSVKIVLNIILDVLFISRFRIVSSKPTVDTQALIKLICDIASTITGLTWFMSLAYRRGLLRQCHISWPKAYQHLLQLVRTGWPLQLEVIPRLVLSMWLSAKIVELGMTWATAWGIFLTIRAGIMFAPLLAIQASCYTFVGHAWGRVARHQSGSKLSLRDFAEIRRTIFGSAVAVIIVEMTMYAAFSFEPGRRLAIFLSGSQAVTEIEVEIWRRLDWAYVTLAIYFQTSSLLLIAKPTYYLGQSWLLSLTCSLPILASGNQKLESEDTRWTYFILAAGLPYCLGLLNNLCWTGVWIYRSIERSRGGSGAPVSISS